MGTYISDYSGEQVDSAVSQIDDKADKSITETIKSASGSLSIAEISGTIINNYGQSADMILTLPTAEEGLSCIVVCGTTIANYIRITTDSSDLIILDGESGADGEYIQIESASLGSAISLMTFKSGESSWEWLAITVSGTWIAEV